MELESAIRRRRMVRSFDDRPLPPAVVERLLANARRGPSAGFTQGVELLVLEGSDQTSRYWDASLPLADRAGFRWPGLLRAPLLIVPFADEAAYRRRYAAPDKASARAAGTEASFPSPWWTVDAAFASMLVLLTAVDAGVGALFFGVFRPDAVREAFGVPPGLTPLGTVAVGYPAPHPASRSLARGRRPTHEVVHRGGW